jgi:hypothetical protein
MVMRSRASTFSTAVALVALAGCVGTIQSTPGERPTGADSEVPFDPDATVMLGDSSVPAPPANAIPATTRFARLTHGQWESTVRDLLMLSEAPGSSAMFAPDALTGSFGNNGTTLRVGQQLWTDYQSAAEALAARVARDPAAVARLLPPNAPADPRMRARAFIEHFGRRAYRRPLSPQEVDQHLTALYDRGAMILGGDAFVSGIELTLRAMLQSPHFLYRVERSDVERGGNIPLDDYEIATRLSYALWNTMPDDELFSAAGRGELVRRDSLLAQARRMLASPRAKTVVLAFHGQLYEWDHFADVRRDAMRFPQWRATLPASMLREAQMFVEDLVFERRAGLTQLLTATHTFVNDDLARVYGLSGSFDGTFRRVELDPSQRRGMFTQVGFLASRAYAVDPDPIHRGVALNLKVLCAELPNPPPNVPALPMVPPNSTNRQTVNAHTGPGTCGAGCHSTLINPAGFAFEGYDSIGAFRTQDRGQPVDATGQYPIDGAQVSFNSAIDLMGFIASSQQAHECYARYWLEFLAGRGPQSEDRALIRWVGAQSRADRPVLELIEAILSSPTFTARSTTVEAMR